MLQITRLLSDDAQIASALRKRARHVILTSSERSHTRQRVRLSDGTQAALLLPRGSVLCAGALLVDERGGLIEVVAAAEPVYRVCARAASEDAPGDLLRAAYHLGNRHVPVQLDGAALRLERDSVLRELLERLGLEVVDAFEPFVPEAGAYGGGHRHDHDHEGGSVGEQLSREAHRHDHGHAHDHAHEHGHPHGAGHDPAHAGGHDPAHAPGHAHRHDPDHEHGSEATKGKP